MSRLHGKERALSHQAHGHSSRESAPHGNGAAQAVGAEASWLDCKRACAKTQPTKTHMGLIDTKGRHCQISTTYHSFAPFFADERWQLRLNRRHTHSKSRQNFCHLSMRITNLKAAFRSASALLGSADSPVLGAKRGKLPLSPRINQHAVSIAPQPSSSLHGLSRG